LESETMNNDVPSPVEEKLPEQIIENVLLEGVDSADLLGNRNIVDIANTLSDVRQELSSILHTEIDEFEFQMMCQGLLQKCSQDIKIKGRAPTKSQAQRPTPQEAAPPIDVDDIYAHLKRQHWHYDDTPVHRIEVEDDPATPKSTGGGGVAVMGQCGDHELLRINGHHPAQHKHCDDTKMDEELGQPLPTKRTSDPMDAHSAALEPPGTSCGVEPGGVHEPREESWSEEAEGGDAPLRTANVTLMGGAEQGIEVKFKKMADCYHDIFSPPPDDSKVDIDSADTDAVDAVTETLGTVFEGDGDGDAADDEDHRDGSDDDTDSLIVSDAVTLMGSAQ